MYSTPKAGTRIEQALDYIVGLASPRRAMLRRHHRAMAEHGWYREAFDVAARLRGYERAYKAASHSKNHTPWEHSSPRSADAEILNDLYTLRNRSRAANRDDALTNGITTTLTRDVIGTGLRPQARTGDDRKDAALEAVWALRKDSLAPGDGNLSHAAHQWMGYFKRHEDGECFYRPATDKPGAPIWIETIEADRVRTPYDADPVDPEGRIVMGVEKDRYGRPVAYWVLKKHPGDTILWETKLGPLARPFVSTFAKQYFDRCPADSICHDRSRVTRPGQTRGMLTFHAVMQDLRDLDLLITAALKRTQVAACIAAFIQSTAQPQDLLQMTAEQYGYQLNQKLEPAMLFRLFPGETVQFINPTQGVEAFEPLIMLLARRIGSSVGMSPQSILKYWEGLSYSAARTVKTDDKKTVTKERHDYGHSVLSWEWRIVHEDELLRGNETLLRAGVTADDLAPSKVEWIGSEEEWVDPVAEAQSTQIALAIGLTSPQTEITRLGRDPRHVLRERLEWELMETEMRKEMGLPERLASQAAIAVGDADDPLTQPEPEKKAG